MTDASERAEATLTRVEITILSASRRDELIAELESMVVVRDVRQVSDGWSTTLELVLLTRDDLTVDDPAALIHRFAEALSGLSADVCSQWDQATSKRFNVMYACRDLDAFRAPGGTRNAAARIGADVVVTTYLAHAEELRKK